MWGRVHVILLLLPLTRVHRRSMSLALCVKFMLFMRPHRAVFPGCSRGVRGQVVRGLGVRCGSYNGLGWVGDGNPRSCWSTCGQLQFLFGIMQVVLEAKLSLRNRSHLVGLFLYLAQKYRGYHGFFAFLVHVVFVGRSST